MAEGSHTLTLLGRALDQVDRLIAGTRPDQADLRTPCQSWTVGQLVHHLVTDMANFAASVRGEKPDWSTPARRVEGDWADTFASARRELDEAWSAADLESLVPSMNGQAPLVSRADSQIAEVAVHTWDLARATGQGENLDADVAEYALRWGRENLAAGFRGTEADGKSFGAQVAVPGDAPVYERLAGWFGRDPRWAAA